MVNQVGANVVVDSMQDAQAPPPPKPPPPHLGEQMVDHVGANVVVDPVEDAVVTVQSGQATAQVAPLLSGASQRQHPVTL